MVGDQVAFDDNTTTPNDKKVGDVLDRESALQYENEIFEQSNDSEEPAPAHIQETDENNE